MKTERRHELQTNWLADWIGVHTEKVKPHAKTLIGIAVVAVAGMFAIALVRGQSEGRQAAAWTQYFSAAEMSDVEGLRDVAARYQGTEAAAWALESAADIEAATGARNLYFDREAAQEHLILAKEAYLQALEASKEVMLLQRAHMGLAQVYESLNQFDEAKSEYALVVARWADSAMAKEASDRMRVLEDPSTKQFYEWFLAQDPLPTTPPPSPAIKPPSVYDDLPDDPDLSLPGRDDLAAPEGSDLSPPEAVEDPQRESEMETEDAEAEQPTDEDATSDAAVEDESNDAAEPVEPDEESTAEPQDQ